MKRSTPKKTPPIVTPEEVAKLLNGEIEDPRHARRILDEAEHDPRVARWFRVLDLESILGDDEDDAVDENLREQVARSMNELRSSTVCAITLPVANRIALLGGQPVSCRIHVTGRDEAALARAVSCNIQPRGGGWYVLEMPEAVPGGKPLSITIANLKLPNAQPSKALEGVSIAWPEVLLSAHHDAKVSPRSRAEMPDDSQVLDKMHLHTMACDTSDGAGLRSFRCELRDGHRLKVYCSSGPDRNRECEPCIIEVAHPVGDRNITFRYGWLVERRSLLDEELVGDFDIPLPHSVERGAVDIRVRAVEEHELWHFGSRQISMLLAQSSPLTVLPLTHEGEHRYTFHVREDEHDSLRKEENTWLLRIAGSGKEGE